MAYAEYMAFGYFAKGPPNEAAAVELRNGRVGVAERLLRGYARNHLSAYCAVRHSSITASGHFSATRRVLNCKWSLQVPTAQCLHLTCATSVALPVLQVPGSARFKGNTHMPLRSG